MEDFCRINNILPYSELYQIIVKIFAGEDIPYPFGAFYGASVNLSGKLYFDMSYLSIVADLSPTPLHEVDFAELIADACLTAKNFNLFTKFYKEVFVHFVKDDNLANSLLQMYDDIEILEFLSSFLSGDALYGYMNDIYRDAYWHGKINLLEYLYENRERYRLERITDPNILFSMSCLIASSTGERKEYLIALEDKLYCTLPRRFE